jgi:hypothetical protein
MMVWYPCSSYDGRVSSDPARLRHVLKRQIVEHTGWPVTVNLIWPRRQCLFRNATMALRKMQWLGHTWRPGKHDTDV